MRRRIDWKLGDSNPDYNSATLNVSGTGDIQIDTDFSTSSVMVGFSRTYLERATDTYGSELELQIWVKSVNDTGFVLHYVNIPEDIPLEINYMAM